MRGLVVLPLFLATCGGNGGTPGTPDAPVVDFDRKALVTNLGTNVILPTFEAFEARAGALVTAVDAWCATPDDAALRSAAQDAWRAAAVEWQKAELMQIGPAMMERHDTIYSWPLVNTCAVDQDVMLRWNDPAAYDISTRLTNRRGLPALEYVLFAPSLAATCPPQTAPPGWDALSEADRLAARCGYAAVAAADLAVQAGALVDAWSTGGYLDAFIASGDSGGAFSSAHEALNAVSDALFILDTDVKDMKLGEPAGIADNSCATVQEPCLADIEARVSGHSKQNIRANLDGFRLVFTGGEGLGFDDFLVAVNAADLATQMLADVDAAIAAVDAIPGTLEEAVQNDRDAVVAAHTAVRVVTDNLKSQFLTVLALDIPDAVATDND